MTANKVLVIDDEKPTLGMFRLFLKAYGYEVLLAENGGQGLELFETHTPSIVFTDIKMPGMDGIEVLDQIKSHAPDTEVIVITGHGDMDLAVEALNHEATDFINKPISRSALESALHRAQERLKAALTGTSNAQLRREETIAAIDIQGSINAASEKELLSVYAGVPDSEEKLLICFEENTSINGAGIAVLIQLLSECKRKQQTVAIAGVSDSFKQIFEMVGITRLAELFNDVADATSYLTSVSRDKTDG